MSAAGASPGSGPDDEFVALRHVTKSFGVHTVLDDFSLTIARGERVAVIGRSGSGKTTLLRLLMTLERPSSGSITIGGVPMWPARDRRGAPTASERHLRAIRARVGLVFQQFNLFPTMTVLANVAEGPRRVLGIDRDEAQLRALALLRQVGLQDKRDRYPAQLSGGEQQRVAIARALAMRPELMLFDEVTSALDPELIGDVLDVIRGIAKESPMTMLLVTHEIGFAREVADRLVFLADGRVAEEGPPEALLDHPRDPRTRAFLNAVLRR
jgi:polar amino acid transport system ATP-binding protein